MYNSLGPLHHCSAADAATCIDIEVMLSPDGDLGATRQALDWVCTQLGVSFNLRPGPCAILLIDSAWHKQLSPQLINALREGRPLVTLSNRLEAGQELPKGSMHSPEAALDLLQQFRLTPVLAEKQPTLAVADDAEPVAWPLLLQQVVQGGKEIATPELLASYGDRACMHFDFSQRMVRCDPLALQHLRLHRELPHPVSHAALQSDAVLRTLDHTLWDLGTAAGSLSLLNEPEDFRHAPLRWEAVDGMRSYSNRPMHLDAWRLLRSSPLSLAQLQRRLRASQAELRQFLQAGLLAGLLDWSSADMENELP